VENFPATTGLDSGTEGYSLADRDFLGLKRPQGSKVASA